MVGTKMRVSVVALLAVILLTEAMAGTVSLKCTERNSKGDPRKFSVVIDPMARSVLDLGYGQGVQTTEFSDATISASHRLDSVPLVVMLGIERFTGNFSIRWLIVGPDGKIDEKTNTSFEGTCEIGRRKL
jgi:hypothetical protein